MIVIERVQPDQGDLIGEVSLRALRTDPGAFPSPEESEAAVGAGAWELLAATSAEGHDQALFIASGKGHPVGLIAVFRDDNHPRSMRAMMLWVEPGSRRQGIGTRLLGRAVEWARDADADSLRAWVSESSLPARALFEKAGFSLAGGRPHVQAERTDGGVEVVLSVGAGWRVPPGYVDFEPMSEDEFSVYWESLQASYAADLMESDGLALVEARRQASAEIDSLLPQGLATPGHQLCSIRSGERQVGWIWFGERRDAGSRYVFLYDIVVFETLRGHGLGSAALDEVEEWARSQSLNTVALHVFEHNVGARSWYARLGYEIARTEPGHVAMIKQL